MDRKKFVTLFSSSLIGAGLLKASPLNFLLPKRTSKSGNAIEVKINPNAVNREKPGKKNG